jgi:hypothetical protein
MTIMPHLLLVRVSSRRDVYNKIKDIRRHMYDSKLETDLINFRLSRIH